LLLILLTVSQHVDARKLCKLNRRIDSLLSLRYWRANIDTNYIIRPKAKWTLLGRVNVSGTRINAEGKYNGEHFRTMMRADLKSTLSLGVSYLGLSLNVSLNPAKLLGKYHDYELNFKTYGKRFGFEVSYLDAHNFRGWVERVDVRKNYATTKDLFRLRTLDLNAYYVFSPLRFSYPAAFGHSYIQHRSAGSFLLAMSGQGQWGELTGGNAMTFKMTNVGIGGGYGYNFVPGRGWLFHISALPTIIVYSHSSIISNDTRIPLRYHFPRGIVTGRGAIVKQIGRNKCVGLSMVYHFTGIGHKESLSVHNQRWFAHLYMGVRL